MTVPSRTLLGPLGLLALLSSSASAAAQQPPPRPQRQMPRPMLLPQAVVVPRGEHEILIDGSVAEWPRLPAIVLGDRRQISGTAHGAWRGQRDASAVAFMMWDEHDLWFSCTVQDEWHRALDARTLQLTEIPAADSVVLTFDPQRDTRGNGPDPGRNDDREFWIAEDSGRQIVQWDRLRGSARLLDEPARMVTVHDTEKGITVHEARIPWSEILPPGSSPEAGLVCDLQIVVNDFDESTDGMPQTRIGWTFGVGPVVDPGLLGSIMLVEDAAVLQGAVPAFPPKPSTSVPPAEPAEFWRELTSGLLQHGPQLHDGSRTPAEAGGVERLRLLETIERHTARMPRVDFLELLQRSHRRMKREVAGLMARGLPSWWRQRIASVSKLASDPVEAGAARLFRLPMGGWLVRSAKANCLIDPVGNDLAEYLWGGAQMCVLTQPLAITRRDDQLLLRMYSVEPKRPVYTHIAFHLPVVSMESMPIARLGRLYGDATTTRTQALGRARADGAVRYDCSYRVELLEGPTLLVATPNLTVADLGDDAKADVLIASPRNAAIVDIAAAVEPQVILLDDAFVCQTHPTTARVTLRDLHALQRALRPHPSVLLAPGESWLVKPAGK